MAGFLEVLPGAALLIVSLGLAALLFYLGPGRRANRVFALLLVLTGIQETSTLVQEASSAPATVALWAALSPYAHIAITFGLAYFVAIYPRPRRWLPSGPAGPALFAAGAVVLLVPYGLNHGLWIDHTTPSNIWFGATPGPLWYATEALDRLVVPGAVFLLARDYLADPEGAHGSSPLLISLGIALSPLFFAPRSLAAQAVEGLPPHPLSTLVPASQAILIGGAATWVTLQGLGSDRADVRRLMGRYGATCGGVALAGVGYGLFLPVGPIFWAILSVLGLVMPMLVAYALVRHQIFGLDLRAKWAVRQSTVVGAFVVVYLLASQAAQRFLADRASVMVGLAAAGVLALGSLSLLRFAKNLSERLFPGVERSETYLDARRLNIYRVALQEQLDERGRLRSGGQAHLARLRRDLGIDERDHAILSHTMKAVRSGEIGAPNLAPGSRLLGRYTILKMLGESPVARTVLVEEEASQRRLVAKGLVPLDASRDAMLHEAQALASIDHENVVHLEAVTEASGLIFLVMEYVEGGALSDWIEDGGMDPSTVRDVGRDLLAALEAVHSEGMVHRDVKPSNVLLTPEGRAKLADFGIARTPQEQTTVSFLGDGAGAGTVRYMSPEQAREEAVDHRSDLYSAAVTLYEAYTGRPYMRVRPAESAFELQVRIASSRGFQESIEPPELRTWFQQALAADPADRFQTAAEMRGQLQDALSARPSAEP